MNGLIKSVIVGAVAGVAVVAINRKVLGLVVAYKKAALKPDDQIQAMI